MLNGAIFLPQSWAVINTIDAGEVNCNTYGPILDGYWLLSDQLLWNECNEMSFDRQTNSEFIFQKLFLEM